MVQIFGSGNSCGESGAEFWALAFGLFYSDLLQAFNRRTIGCKMDLAPFLTDFQTNKSLNKQANKKMYMLLHKSEAQKFTEMCIIES